MMKDRPSQPISGTEGSDQLAYRQGIQSLAPWRIQWRVVDALIYRELKTRISQVKFGFIGVLVQPLMVMSVFLMIFGFLQAGSGGPLDIGLFLAAGIVLFTLFNDIAIRSLNAMDANEALFFYRPVKPVDTVIARAIVESGLYGLILLIIVSGIWVLKEQVILVSFVQLVAAFLLLAFTALGVGLTMMVAGHRFSVVKQVVPLFMRPLWFTSGVFFSLQGVPQQFRPWLSWNPILQAIELSRNAFSQSYVLEPSISMVYLAFCSLISLTFGLGVYMNNEKFLLKR
jgi:capsular polysaccharide transport system permease protein